MKIWYSDSPVAYGTESGLGRYLGHSGPIPEFFAHSCRWSPDSPGTARRSRASPGRRCRSSGRAGYSIWSWTGCLCQTGTSSYGYSLNAFNRCVLDLAKMHYTGHAVDIKNPMTTHTTSLSLYLESKQWGATSIGWRLLVPRTRRRLVTCLEGAKVKMFFFFLFCHWQLSCCQR